MKGQENKPIADTWVALHYINYTDFSLKSKSIKNQLLYKLNLLIVGK